MSLFTASNQRMNDILITCISPCTIFVSLLNIFVIMLEIAFMEYHSWYLLSQQHYLPSTHTLLPMSVCMPAVPVPCWLPAAALSVIGSSLTLNGLADFYMSLYNVLFTVLPPMVVGIFDQDVSRSFSLRYPGQLLCYLHEPC